jgi:2-isopropylmalate synthase
MKSPETYLPFMPEQVGAERVEMVLGKHSGRAAFKARLEKLGIALDDEQLNRFTTMVVQAPKTAWEDTDTLMRETAENIRAGT